MMPGYLDHVLARAFGQGPVLRSRPRSLFEPVYPAHPLAWPEDPGAPLVAPQPALAAGLFWPDPEPGPEPRALPGSEPDPSPDAGQTRAPEVPPVVAGPEPPEDEHAPSPFGTQELTTERPSGGQPPANQSPLRTHAAAASLATARPPSAAHAVSPTARGLGTRPTAHAPEPEGPAARRPQPAAPVPDRSPGQAPAEPAAPATVIAAARRQPSPSAADRPPRRSGASPGEPSHAPARVSAAETLVPVSHRDTTGPPAVAGAPSASRSPGATEPLDRPDPPAAGRRLAPAIPRAVARPPRVADPQGATDSLAASAIPGPVAVAPVGQARRRQPSTDMAPAPVVNVTIGRVEVRPPPPPPPPSAAPAPGPRPLSLADYLERRNRGPS